MRRLVTVMILIVMSLLMVNRVLYTHIHIQLDGSIVSHAHPFPKSTDDSSENEHQHSALEFFLLDQLDVLTLCALAIFVLKAFNRSRVVRFCIRERLLPSLVPVSPGRAPPACM